VDLTFVSIFVSRHPRRSGQHFRIYKHLAARFCFFEMPIVSRCASVTAENNPW
jgi:hypothetical protein